MSLAQAFLETRPKSASLEPFADLLAYMDPEVWLKNSILTKFKKLQEKYDLLSNGKLGQP